MKRTNNQSQHKYIPKRLRSVGLLVSIGTGFFLEPEGAGSSALPPLWGFDFSFGFAFGFAFDFGVAGFALEGSAGLEG